MPFWPFKSNVPEQPSIEEVRHHLIEAAASSSAEKLKRVCKRYTSRVAENLDFMCKAPDEIRTNPDALKRYIQCLGAVAQCLALECGAPELWQRLSGGPENPLARWQKWFEELPARIDRLEHDRLIPEARTSLEQARSLMGSGARHFETFFNGALGELLFHSGHVTEALAPFQKALASCEQMHDIEGQVAYTSNLMEVHRYLGTIDDAVAAGTSLVSLLAHDPGKQKHYQRQIEIMKRGEPLCRVVCVVDGEDWEVDDVRVFPNQSVTFQFRRNRLALMKASILTSQGNTLASSGRHEAATEKYSEARDVDPYDPDPVYQMGVCLLEMDVYSEAMEAFDEVERLAPAWFQSRADRWLAGALARGEVSRDDFRALRAVQDGGLSRGEARRVAAAAVELNAGFAPMYLLLGDLMRAEDADEATNVYRKGLDVAAEPDVESRLACALAAALPKGSRERDELLKRATTLDGHLVAKASAKLMQSM